MARSWTPEQRRSQRQQMRSRWADPDERTRILQRRAVGTVRAAVRRDPRIADALIAAAIEERQAVTP